MRGILTPEARVTVRRSEAEVDMAGKVGSRFSLAEVWLKLLR